MDGAIFEGVEEEQILDVDEEEDQLGFNEFDDDYSDDDLSDFNEYDY